MSYLGEYWNFGLHFPTRINIKEKIDAIEEKNLAGLRVEYDNNDPSECTIIIDGIDDFIKLTETSISIMAFINTSPLALATSFKESVQRIGVQIGIPLLGA